MQALVDHHSQFENNTLPDWKPVKITQNWSDVVELQFCVIFTGFQSGSVLLILLFA